MENITPEQLEKLKAILKETGEMLKTYFHSGKFSKHSKGGVDFATEADDKADAFLSTKLKELFPTHHLLTEETAPKDYSSFRQLDNVWIVDPIDGTVNFSRGNPHFSISVALVDKGQPKFGIVYVPIADKLYYAFKDSFVFLNDKEIHVSKTEDLKETVFACDWPWNLEKRKIIVSWIDKICTNVRQVKCLGSAVYDLALLAEGQIDVYIHAGLKPWDFAASALFIEQSGGKITRTDGSPFNVFEEDILATNKLLHTQILDLIK